MFKLDWIDPVMNGARGPDLSRPAGLSLPFIPGRYCHDLDFCAPSGAHELGGRNITVEGLAMPSKATVKIESRVHLLSTLAEAAELEHDLMCMYLYSVFSLKTSTGEGLTSEEMEAVNCWRKTILDVCFEEMTHLALVANLTTAVGGGAHFFRPDFPVRARLFPLRFCS